MRTFNIKVNGVSYAVEVEEVGSTAAPAASAPAAAAPAPAAAAAARRAGVRGIIAAAGSADRAGGAAVIAGAGARAAVRAVRVAGSADRTGVPAAGVAAGIGDEAGEHDAAIDAVITHKVRPPEISLGGLPPTYLMTEGLRLCQNSVQSVCAAPLASTMSDAAPLVPRTSGTIGSRRSNGASVFLRFICSPQH